MNTHRLRATELRKEGYSYRMIHNELGVPMSTLSGWFRDLPYSPNDEAKRRILSGRYAYGIARKEARLLEITQLGLQGKDEVGPISKRDLWMVGLGLWLGEGSKTTEQIRFSNANPEIVKLWVKWLRDVCSIPASHIFVTIHTYPDSDEVVCKNYWSEVMGQKGIRFGKTQFDKRSVKSKSLMGKLPYGTVHISVRTNGDSEKGVKLYRRLVGWVSAILETDSGYAGIV